MSRNITHLREALFDAIAAVRAGTMPLEQARHINDVARTLVETAKVEVEYLRVTGETQSTFIDPLAAAALPAGAEQGNAIAHIVRHRLKG